MPHSTGITDVQLITKDENGEFETKTKEVCSQKNVYTEYSG